MSYVGTLTFGISLFSAVTNFNGEILENLCGIYIEEQVWELCVKFCGFQYGQKIIGETEHDN